MAVELPNPSSSLRDDVDGEHTSHRSTESFQSTGSDNSVPATPVFSTRAHSRYPSSNSSLSSTPPTHDYGESLTSSVKLPKLAEEPLEPDHGFVMVESDDPSPCLCDVDHCSHQQSSLSSLTLPSSPVEYSDSLYSTDVEIACPQIKRRQSQESQIQNVVGRIESRLPSFTRKMRDRKRRSSLMSARTRASTPSRAPSSRSSSFTSAHAAGMESFEGNAPPSPSPDSQDVQEVDESEAFASIEDMSQDVIVEPIDREALASTPLLPPTLTKLSLGHDTPFQSPLQSPSIADSPVGLFPADDTPAGTPHLRGVPTPPLSTKPSCSSLALGRPTILSSPTLDSPSIRFEGPFDKWCDRLGHANFNIEPEPYVPEAVDVAAVRQLFADWEQARRNFLKYQVRTGDHYGVTSKIYKLTEQKWAEIDAEWRRNHDAVKARIPQAHDRPSPSSADTAPAEPAPLVKYPSLEELQRKGKMPVIGDDEIVGPMMQIAAKAPHHGDPARRKAGGFFRFLTDFRSSPRSVFGRTLIGYRSAR